MTVYLPLRQSDRGVTRLDGPLGKKQVWRHHVRTSSLSAANILYLRKYLLHCWEFSAPPQWFGAGELCTLAPPCYAHALRLHMSQIHCSGVMQWWACSSLMSAPLPAEAGCQTCEQTVPLLVFIVYLCTATKLIFASSYDMRRFATCDWWMQTYWQVMQRDSDCW